MQDQAQSATYVLPFDTLSGTIQSFTTTASEFTWVLNNAAGGATAFWLPGYKDEYNNWKWEDTGVVFYSNMSVCTYFYSVCPWFGGLTGNGNYLYYDSGFWHSANASSLSLPFIITYGMSVVLFNCLLYLSSTQIVL
jgi:hypothetical protein